MRAKNISVIVALSLLSMLVLGHTCSTVSASPQEIVYTITWDFEGYSITVRAPEHAEPGDRITVEVEVTSLKDLYYSLDVSLEYGDSRYSNVITLLEDRYIAAGGSATKSQTFVVPDEVESGPVIIVVEVYSLGAYDYAVIEGEEFFLFRAGLFPGPYVESREVTDLRGSHQQLSSDYDDLKSDYDELSEDLDELRTSHERVELVMYGLGASTAVLAVISVVIYVRRAKG